MQASPKLIRSHLNWRIVPVHPNRPRPCRSASADGPTPVESPAPSDCAAIPRPPAWRLFGALSLLGVYSCGVVILMLRLLVSLLAVRRLRHTGRPLRDAAWTLPLNRCKERLSITRLVALAASPAVGVPLAFGWLRPTVMIPEHLVRALNDKQREAVLLHELAANDRGLSWVVQRMNELKEKHGKRFEPSEPLKRRAEAGQGILRSSIRANCHSEAKRGIWVGDWSKVPSPARIPQSR